jgi:hypothetical protein
MIKYCGHMTAGKCTLEQKMLYGRIHVKIMNNIFFK